VTKHDEFRQHAKTIETLVGKLEEAADPSLRSTAKELVNCLMELHGAGIERMLAVVRDAGEPGSAILERLGSDEMVRSLLLLYGLHPQDLQTRVHAALESCDAFLKPHDASIALAAIDEESRVTVHFRGQSAGGCGSAAGSLKARVEAALVDAAPDAASIVVKDVSAPSLPGASFVSIAALQNSSAIAAIAEPRVQENGD
jgi:Fe-S cluster biogenesis protein NfuA